MIAKMIIKSGMFMWVTRLINAKTYDSNSGLNYGCKLRTTCKLHSVVFSFLKIHSTDIRLCLILNIKI